jgi:hypothetical protein
MIPDFQETSRERTLTTPPLMNLTRRTEPRAPHPLRRGAEAPRQRSSLCGVSKARRTSGGVRTPTAKWVRPGTWMIRERATYCKAVNFETYWKSLAWLAFRRLGSIVMASWIPLASSSVFHCARMGKTMSVKEEPRAHRIDDNRAVQAVCGTATRARQQTQVVARVNADARELGQNEGTLARLLTGDILVRDLCACPTETDEERSTV